MKLILTAIVLFSLNSAFARERASYISPTRKIVVMVNVPGHSNIGYCKAQVRSERTVKNKTTRTKRWIRCGLENGRCPKRATDCWNVSRAIKKEECRGVEHGGGTDSRDCKANEKAVFHELLNLNLKPIAAKF